MWLTSPTFTKRAPGLHMRAAVIQAFAAVGGAAVVSYFAYRHVRRLHEPAFLGPALVTCSTAGAAALHVRSLDARSLVCATALHLGTAVSFVLIKRSDPRAPSFELPPRQGNFEVCALCSKWVDGICRPKHCHECEACIDGFDHHCVWLDSASAQKTTAPSSSF